MGAGSDTPWAVGPANFLSAPLPPKQKNNGNQENTTKRKKENENKPEIRQANGPGRVRSRVIRSCDRGIMRSWGRYVILGSLCPSFRAKGAPLQGDPWPFLPSATSRGSPVHPAPLSVNQ